MADPAYLDVRKPIGALFAILGALLAIYGLSTGPGVTPTGVPLQVNVNLWWGMAMTVFGAVLLQLSEKHQ
jgi:hypothetical protein